MYVYYTNWKLVMMIHKPGALHTVEAPLVNNGTRRTKYSGVAACCPKLYTANLRGIHTESKYKDILNIVDFAPYAGYVQGYFWYHCLYQIKF